MATVLADTRGRLYMAPTAIDERVAEAGESGEVASNARTSFLSGATPTRAMITGGVCSAYGLRTWGHLFTDRQLVALTTFSDLVSEVREKVLADAISAGMDADAPRLADGGTSARAYADAVATYLGFAVAKAADLGNSLCRWEPIAQCPRQLFARQAIPMVVGLRGTKSVFCFVR